MAGEHKAKREKVLACAMSTPCENQAGVQAAIDFAKLATYQVNVRSFHPNKQFERGGFRFHADNRGFSLGESWFDAKGEVSGKPTSRVWQHYELDLSRLAVGANAKKGTKLKQESNTSGPGPGIWSFAGGEEKYEDKALKPRGKIAVIEATTPHGGQKEFAVKSWYGGENHAFLMSKTANDVLGATFVPTLDVHAELFIRVERIQLYMDIASLGYGDGFPNTESFIRDAAGNAVFLGSHVRIGVPATHLAGDAQRLMWANAVRVEIDKDGNFGERLWVFTQVLGGPPELRDEYLTNPNCERCAPNATPRFFSNPFNDSPPSFTWDCGRPEAISQRTGRTALPLHLSAFIDLEKVRRPLREVWTAGPVLKMTRTEWNEWHLHRNPNQGRAPDAYDVAPEKWRKP